MGQRKRSSIWMHFSIDRDGKATCNICQKSISFKSGSTNNLHRHLKTLHPIVEVAAGGKEPAESDNNESVDEVSTEGENTEQRRHTRSQSFGVSRTYFESQGQLVLCDDALEPNSDTTRKKSVVWGFFKTVDSQTVKCLLCSENLSKRVQGTTTAMLRHLRVKHPKEVTKACKGRQPKTGPTNGHQDVSMDSAQFSSVEVVLEDGDSDIQTTPMESDINSAINEILKSAEGDQEKQAKNGEASDSHPVRRNRHKRSLIWKHYERLESLNAARCSICMKKLQCFEGGSTSNLRRHMSKRHPEVFSRLVADGLKPPPYDLSQCSKVTSDSLTTAETTGPKEPEQFVGSRPPEGERRVFRRERELIEALRRTQKEEARALEHQRELLEKLRAADAREETAEREKIELLRKLQQEEAKELNGLKESLQKEREELEQEKLELQKKWEELQQEREDLLLYSRGELTS
ncbi:uncharacterized protein LOC115041090 isoform X2 [Echeneis naucrates]|uniref:uncharacterized protein LOC115041090 isoform X2 n=1 Tax=Echeneis naucrates TaxID=173247 RepID=UPI00111429F0|nr:uncharacterized protein LOC115041090 isoform X2 [Echeneis naucrates]